MGLLDGLLKQPGNPVMRSSADLLTSYEARVDKINALEDEIEQLSDDQLRRGRHETPWSFLFLCALRCFPPALSCPPYPPPTRNWVIPPMTYPRSLPLSLPRS